VVVDCITADLVICVVRDTVKSTCASEVVHFHSDI